MHVQLNPTTPTQATDQQPRPRSLVTTLLVVNAAVLIVIAVLLSLTPVRVSAPFIKPAELAVVLIGLLVLLGLYLVILRRVLAPLTRLADLMRSIDPDHPGRRVEGIPLNEVEVATLAGAFNDMLDRLESERRESARVALAAQEGERLRVARELHDEIGQSLTAAALKAERAADAEAIDSQAALHSLVADIHKSLEDVRRIARELRPEALDDLGLVNALITLCSRLSTQSGLPIDREFARDLPAVPEETELVIYRVAQESLTNAVRHADATKAQVSLTVENGNLVLRIGDNGVGLPDDLPEGTAGLAGMRERALLVNGLLTIHSQRGKGTRVELSIPLSSLG